MFYKYFLERDGAFTISLAAVYGDPDVFVSIDNQKPDETNYTWGQREYGNDMLVISPDHPSYRYNVWYYIGIAGWTGSLYNLVVSHEDSTFFIFLLSTNLILAISILGDGIPCVDQLVQNNRAYFKFEMLVEKNITISVTPKSTGDPDMYVSTKYERPNETHYEWKGMRYGADTITITTDDPNFKVGTYYIGVKAYTDTTFTILVSGDEGYSYISFILIIL
jgi:hypothetical protein